MTLAAGMVADTDSDDDDDDGEEEEETRPSVSLPIYTNGAFTISIKFILVQLNSIKLVPDRGHGR